MLDRDPLPIPPERKKPPSETKMWIVNVVAFLVVSVLTLLFFYHRSVWFLESRQFFEPAAAGPARTEKATFRHAGTAANKRRRTRAAVAIPVSESLPLPLGKRAGSGLQKREVRGNALGILGEFRYAPADPGPPNRKAHGRPAVCLTEFSSFILPPSSFP